MMLHIKKLAIQFSKTNPNPNIRTFMGRLGNKFYSNNPECTVDIKEGEPKIEITFTDARIFTFSSEKDDDMYNQINDYGKRLQIEKAINTLK